MGPWVSNWRQPAPPRTSGLPFEGASPRGRTARPRPPEKEAALGEARSAHFGWHGSLAFFEARFYWVAKKHAFPLLACGLDSFPHGTSRLELQKVLTNSPLEGTAQDITGPFCPCSTKSCLERFVLGYAQSCQHETESLMDT